MLSASARAVNAKSPWLMGAESHRTFMGLNSQAPISFYRTFLNEAVTGSSLGPSLYNDS